MWRSFLPVPVLVSSVASGLSLEPLSDADVSVPDFPVDCVPEMVDDSEVDVVPVAPVAPEAPPEADESVSVEA